MTRSLRARRHCRGGGLVVGVLAVGLIPLPQVTAQGGAGCGTKLTDWLDPGGTTTYIGNSGTGKDRNTAYTIVFKGGKVTSTPARAGEPDATSVAYRFYNLPSGTRLAWENPLPKDVQGRDEGAFQFELKHPTCAHGGAAVTEAVATVAVPVRDSDDAAGPFYCDTAYRVGKGSKNPSAPPQGVCAPAQPGPPGR
ncbi:MAG TPA: hypothetical protein VHU88_08735 [Sporichthyaceae bacterium]|jgi:hypothetical protein|nr:hypothetical protein [Sporichthyaceae bacterium]